MRPKGHAQLCQVGVEGLYLWMLQEVHAATAHPCLKLWIACGLLLEACGPGLGVLYVHNAYPPAAVPCPATGLTAST